MTPDSLMSILLGALGASFAIIISLVAWIANGYKKELGELRIEVKEELGKLAHTINAAVDKSVAKVEGLRDHIGTLEGALRGSLAEIDRRVTRVEERCFATHADQQSRPGD